MSDLLVQFGDTEHPENFVQIQIGTPGGGMTMGADPQDYYDLVELVAQSNLVQKMISPDTDSLVIQNLWITDQLVEVPEPS